MDNQITNIQPTGNMPAITQEKLIHKKDIFHLTKDMFPGVLGL